MSSYFSHIVPFITLTSDFLVPLIVPIQITIMISEITISIDTMADLTLITQTLLSESPPEQYHKFAYSLQLETLSQILREADILKR